MSDRRTHRHRCPECREWFTCTESHTFDPDCQPCCSDECAEIERQRIDDDNADYERALAAVIASHHGRMTPAEAEAELHTFRTRCAARARQTDEGDGR